MPTSPNTRRCLGHNCSLSSSCKHVFEHPALDNHFFQPSLTGDECNWYEDRRPARIKSWGEGPEESV